MHKPDIEKRAAELHEGCRMPMKQARELAASEAGPDWYARGQDWGLADALTNCQNGEWTLDDIAQAFAAGAEAKTTMKVEISSDPELLRRAIGAETEAALLRAAIDQKHAEYLDLREPLRRLWPLIERTMKDYVFTGDKAGEVAADMAALHRSLES
jgi:hypothetical protein